MEINRRDKEKKKKYHCITVSISMCNAEKTVTDATVTYDFLWILIPIFPQTKIQTNFPEIKRCERQM